jgi:hypothetical protein
MVGLWTRCLRLGLGLGKGGSGVYRVEDVAGNLDNIKKEYGRACSGKS